MKLVDVILSEELRWTTTYQVAEVLKTASIDQMGWT